MTARKLLVRSYEVVLSRRLAVAVAVASALAGSAGAFASGSGLTVLSAPAGLDAASLQTTMTTALAPYWGAILGISVLTFAIGMFIMVFKRKTTGAVSR